MYPMGYPMAFPMGGYPPMPNAQGAPPMGYPFMPQGQYMPPPYGAPPNMNPNQPPQPFYPGYPPQNPVPEVSSFILCLFNLNLVVFYVVISCLLIFYS